MTNFKSEYLGKLRTKNIHLKSASELITDAPVDNHGKGEAFSPTDLLAISIGSCMMTVMGILANKNGWNLDGMTYESDKKMQASPRKIKEVKIHFNLPNPNLTKEQSDQLKYIAINCPVSLSLDPSVIQTVTFNF